MRRGFRLAVVAATLAAACDGGEASDESTPAEAPAPAKAEAPPQAPATAEVTIASNPSGAKVLLGGAELGTTPYDLKVRGESKIVVAMSGYRSEALTVHSDGEPNISITLEEIEPIATGGEEPDAAGEPANDPAGAAAATDKAAPAKDATSAPKKKKTKPKAAASKPSADAKPAADKDAAPKSSRPKSRYRNVAEAKREYQAGKITRSEYDVQVRRLKNKRADKLNRLKARYRNGEITRDEYRRQKRIIDNDYKGT